MHDPIPAPAFLFEATKPLADRLFLKTLPYHMHEIIIGFCGYHFVLHYLSPAVSKAICPKIYNGFNKRTRLNWDIHWVSMVQALFINSAALYVIFSDPQRQEMDWKGRLWGYTPASGMVQGFAAGYFLWDLQISTQYIALSGPSALLHAIGALAVTCIGFVGYDSGCHTVTNADQEQRPFGNYYGLSFVLYELSTPFLNIHWFCDKLNLTGSKIQFYNGIALLVTFFACRLVWGSYQSYLIYSDIYTALSTLPNASISSLMEDGKCAGNVSGMSYGGMSTCEIAELPMWLVIIYLAGNTALSVLNFYWFSQMLKAVRKRFVAPAAKANRHAEKSQ